MRTKTVQGRLHSCACVYQAKRLQRYFKTRPGEYGEGDIFIGVQVPQIRQIVKEFQSLPLGKVVGLLRSKIHEERLAALLLLVMQFAKGDDVEREHICKIYLQNTRYINNWDLVDASADKIVGAFLVGKPKDVLYQLARSASLWERRIAILSTFHFIKRREFRETFKVARTLLEDKEDLIHKATGWMLREAGKRDRACLERFLKKHYTKMPRTMLRYAIERFPESRRKAYLRGKM